MKIPCDIGGRIVEMDEEALEGPFYENEAKEYRLNGALVHRSVSRGLTRVGASLGKYHLEFIRRKDGSPAALNVTL